MTELHFELTFRQNQERTYVKHPFTVPAGTDRMEIDYDYPRFGKEQNQNGIKTDEENIIDLGLYSPDGELKGWSGSDKKSIFICATEATAGYIPCPLCEGQWAAALGLYKIKSEVTVKLHIRFYPKQKRLYKGDIHMHTINSDGAYTTSEVIDFCKKAGLDFIALTDHNNTVQNTEIGHAENITVIPGMEYTNYRGHANFYFNEYKIQTFDSALLSNTFDEMKKIFLEAKARGALISLNHVDCPFCGWKFGYTDFPYDMVEVWNGPMKESEMRAIARWHQWLCEGKKIPAVGGSDTHRNELARTYGTPTTFVYADGNSVDELRTALSKGNSFISIAPNGPRLNMDIDGKIFGETVSWKAGLTGKFSVEGCNAGDIVKLINGKNQIVEQIIPFRGVYTQKFAVEKASFYRLELYRNLIGIDMLVSLSNPIYVE